MICVIHEVKDLYAILEELKKTAKKYNLELEDPRVPKIYEMEQDYIREKASRLDYAMREGFHKTQRKIARALKARNYPLSEIVGITELSMEEISAL